MTALVLVRHGETVWHEEGRYAGTTDISLSPRGLQQAADLGRWARQARPSALWASPLGRTQATAAPAARATGLPVRTDPRLRELDFGEAEGRTLAEIEEAFPDALEHFLRDPVAGHLPSGEPPGEAADRAVACFEEIAATHEGERVLVVLHTTLLRLALCRLLGLPLRDYRRRFPIVRNGALNEIALSEGSCALLQFNAEIGAGRLGISER